MASIIFMHALSILSRPHDQHGGSEHETPQKSISGDMQGHVFCDAQKQKQHHSPQSNCVSSPGIKFKQSHFLATLLHSVLCENGQKLSRRGGRCSIYTKNFSLSAPCRSLPGEEMTECFESVVNISYRRLVVGTFEMIAQLRVLQSLIFLSGGRSSHNCSK